MTTNDIIEKYEAEFGEIRKDQGYSLSVSISAKGNFVCTHYYEPNVYKTETIRTVVYDQNGIKK